MPCPRLLVALLPALLALLAPAVAADPVREERPNVLFVAVDDLRPWVGAYGHPAAVTPHIDRLAASGTRFDRAYCNVPVCGPSRASVLTGLRARSNQWRTADLEGSFVSLPAHLGAAGYRTAALGKVLHHLDDRAEDWTTPPWRSAAMYHGEHDWAGYNHYGVWQAPSSAAHVNPGSGRGPYAEAADVPDEAYQDGQVAARAVAELERLAAGDAPFFLAVGFWRPHLPFNAPKRYWDLYDRADLPPAAHVDRPDAAPDRQRSSGEIDRYALTGVRKDTDEFRAEARHAYLAAVSYVDANVGRLLDALDRLELTEDTLVVLWSDHGFSLGESAFWGKHTTRHDALRVPLVLRVPGREQVAATSELVELVDLYPTICELVGVPAPAHLAGTSRAALLFDPQAAGAASVEARWSGCRALVTERHLYTRWGPAEDAAERTLFDLVADPHERRDLSDEAAAAELVAELDRLLDGR